MATPPRLQQGRIPSGRFSPGCGMPGWVWGHLLPLTCLEPFISGLASSLPQTPTALATKAPASYCTLLLHTNLWLLDPAAAPHPTRPLPQPVLPGQAETSKDRGEGTMGGLNGAVMPVSGDMAL